LQIFYIKHADINRQKWDESIENSANGLIYAYSFYLDTMSENWDALMMGDYEVVMPLTWKRKWGITYLYQPAFTQQLGIFGKAAFKEDITEAFLDKAFKLFSFAEINLNFANKYRKATREKCNMVLPLNISFDETEKKFRQDFVKNFRKNNLMYDHTEDFKNAILLFEKSKSKKVNISKNNYDHFLQLCGLFKNKGDLIVRKATMGNGELLSTALLFKDRRRIYYILSTTSEEGRKKEANYFLLYNLIKEFSEQDLIFDFEGSDIPGIKSFFKKFGAIEQPYYFVAINKFPFLPGKIKSSYNNFKLFSKKIQNLFGSL